MPTKNPGLVKRAGIFCCSLHRLIVPAKLRKALQLEAGDEVVLRLENGSLRLIPLRQAVSLAQEAVRKYVPEGVSLVDELVQARRAEAKHE